MDNIEADATLRNNPYYGTPQLKHLFVDSETVSHGFGYPNASKPEDIAGCLCMGITQTGQSDATFGVWFCIGEVMYAGKHYLPGKTFPCYILCFRNEKEMLFEFYKWYKKNDPDAYVTWNGQNYDWPYILRRMEMHNLPTDFGRMGNSIASPWDQLQTKGFWQKKRLENENEEGQHWKDSIDFVGRLSMDGLPWFRTKFPLKAENYSLKTMANAFLRPKNQDEIDAKSEKDEKALGLTQDSDDWILKVLLKQNSHSKIDLPASKISPYFFYSPLTRYALAAYCYRDAELCWKMFRDTKMVDFYFELLGLTNANSYIAQNRGQKYLVFNRLGLHVEMLHMILNGEDFTLIKPDEYAGGFVFPPVPGLHLAAFIMDFSSLYPSLIQSYCLSYDSFLLDNVRDEKVAMRMGYEVVTIQEGGQTYKFVQLPPGKESLLNDFYKHLLAERKMHKEAVKQAKLKNDSVKITYHSTAEKAVKTLANAAYGFCGSGEKHNEGSAQRPHYKGLYYPLNGFFPIAISTTSKGRENIQKVFDSISTSGKTLTIYGDTDSVCASFTIHHAMQVVEPFRSEWSSIQNRFEKATLSDHEGKESIQTVKKDMQLLERKVLSRIYQEASNIRDSAAHKMRLTLEIENFFWFLLMMDKKKKYFGSTVTRTDQTPDIIDGKPIYYFSYGIKERGVESVRSDCPQLIRRIIRKVLTLLVEPTDEDKNFGMSGIWLCPDHPFIKKRQQRVFRQVSEFLQEQSFALVTGQVKIDELAVGKSLKADYKKLPSHAVVAKRLAKEGRPLEVGTKLYVIRIVKEGVKDEDKWEELETVLAKKLPVDYFYYFETLLFRMITRMLVATKLFQPHDLEIIFSAAKQASAQQQGNYSITRYFTAPASKTTSELLLLK
jgi:DNA polymerase elongation subunit (family B)